MKYMILAAAAAFAPALSQPTKEHVEAAANANQWTAPGANDARSPCPMLNSLANHGFLPHNGKTITENHTVNALSSALSIHPAVSRFLFQEAATTNPQPNATFFDLDHLNRHNILEHDASLSRQDAFFGNNHVFNETIFNQTRSHWKDVIDVQQAAEARTARIQASNATNPNFTMSNVGLDFGLGESAAYIIVLGDKNTNTVNRSFVEYLFQNERLPTAIGWKKANSTLTIEELENSLELIANASGVQPVNIKRRSFHSVYTRLDGK